MRMPAYEHINNDNTKDFNQLYADLTRSHDTARAGVNIGNIETHGGTFRELPCCFSY